MIRIEVTGGMGEVTGDLLALTARLMATMTEGVTGEVQVVNTAEKLEHDEPKKARKPKAEPNVEPQPEPVAETPKVEESADELASMFGDEPAKPITNKEFVDKLKTLTPIKGGGEYLKTLLAPWKLAPKNVPETEYAGLCAKVDEWLKANSK